MTKKENLVVAKRLWENGQFYPVGTPLATVAKDAPGGSLEDKRLSTLVDSGFLADRNELEKAQNPEAFTARQAVADAEATIADLRRQLEELQKRPPSVGDHSTTGHDLLGDLKGVLPDVTSVEDAVTQIKALQKTQGVSGADATALAEYRDVVGELLPADYPERKLLFSLGYYTEAMVAATSDDALRDEDGIGPAKFDAIRARTPYRGE